MWFKICILFSPSLLKVTRQEFRIEIQFMLTDFDGDDEGHVLFLEVTVLTQAPAALAVQLICIENSLHADFRWPLLR